MHRSDEGYWSKLEVGCRFGFWSMCDEPAQRCKAHELVEHDLFLQTAKLSRPKPTSVFRAHLKDRMIQTFSVLILFGWVCVGQDGVQ